MKNRIDLAKLLPDVNGDIDRRLGLFALINLGVVELLANGRLSVDDVMQYFFHADNCQYVRKKLRDRIADKIMSHGVQLQDLFDVLPEHKAQQEFQRELASIRSLCLQLLDQRLLVA